MYYCVNMALHVHLGRERPLYELSLLGISHLVVGPSFRCRVSTDGQRSDEVVIAKKVDMWP